MAEQLPYEVPPPEFPGAREELSELLEVLHKSGTLRTLTDFVGKLGPVSDIALGEINADPGRKLIGVLLLLGELATKLPSVDPKVLSDGLSRGMTAASAALAKPAPSSFGLLKQLNDEDTRRSLSAFLAFAAVAGGAIRASYSTPPSTHSAQAR